MFLQSDTLDYKIKLAKKVIRSAIEKSKEPLIINYSGGKDSSVLLDLVLEETRDVEALFMASGIDLPKSVEHVITSLDKQEDIFLHLTFPEDYQGDFAYWLRKFDYFPATGYTWCSSRLKMRPARAYFREIYGKAELFKLNGVRRLESSRRKRIYPVNKGYIYKDCEHSGSKIVMPILDWTDRDVKDYLKRKNISINQNYKTCGVSGCMYCPFYQPKIYKQINKAYPNIYKDIIKLEEEIGKPAVVGNLYLKKVLKKEHSLSLFQTNTLTQ